MILKPRFEDLKAIGFYLGKITLGLAFTMLIPVLTGLFYGETDPAADFVIGIEISVLLGLTLQRLCRTDKDLNWMQGMIVVSLSWFVAMFLGAIPLYLSGHWKSYLDACFEAMSGFATTGLTLVQDLDHLSRSHNLWRHFASFIGGQGIAIIALSLFVRGTSGAFRMYVGEGRDERLVPNVVNTARFIWLISIVFFILGTLSLGATGIFIGLEPINAFFHGACIFMAGFDTAGFAPQSQNILYYHSFLFETVAVIFMILGALSFNLHYQVWIGNRKEIFKSIEMRTFFVSIILIFLITAYGLSQSGIYPQATVLFRKGFFQLVSSHSTTGYMTIYAKQFISDWNSLALLGIVLSMALGGCACSTAGGIKVLRAGIIFHALVQDIKKIILPDRAVVIKKFHHIKEVFLEDKLVRSALMVTVCYLILYGVGALTGVIYGYPFLESLFESVSAAANAGLSCGITSASMPAGLKITYIIQMWAGRLEFMSIFTLMGVFVAVIKGR